MNKKREDDTMSAMLIFFFYICTVFVSVTLWCTYIVVHRYKKIVNNRFFHWCHPVIGLQLQ